MTDRPRPVLLDACVALNLLASGVDLGTLADASPSAFLMARFSAAEVLWLDPLEAGGHREEVSVAPLVSAGLLSIVEMSESDQALFVDLAQVLDDGEAATIAIGLVRGIAIATDDRKACRVVSERSARTLVWRTTDLLSAWADAVGDEDRVRSALLAIEARACFRPSRDDPRQEWWSHIRRVGDLSRGGGRFADSTRTEQKFPDT